MQFREREMKQTKMKMRWMMDMRLITMMKVTKTMDMRTTKTTTVQRDLPCLARARQVLVRKR